jgi:FkbM family methyltransferase
MLFSDEPRGGLAINEADVGSHGLQPDSGDKAIPVWTMDEVLRRSPGGRINILKLDVEGAEVEILRPPTPWLASVDCIIVELHNEEGFRDIPNWLADAGFKVKQCRGLFFCNR